MRGIAGRAGPLLGMVVAVMAVTPPVHAASHYNQRKIAELLRAHEAQSMGQHKRYHQMIMALSKKYPNDRELQELHRIVHRAMHERMLVEEQLHESKEVRRLMNKNR